MSDVVPAFHSPDVAAAFDAFPAPERAGLIALRALILKVAAEDPRIGAIEETLKWGQPSYHTSQTGSGTPIRLGLPKSSGYALFTHCQTRVIPEFRALFEAEFEFDGNRAVLFDATQRNLPVSVSGLIRSALTYKLKG
ncbi:MAG: DUF1801 domain-containing protein [Paracoccaceae bacterium]